MLVEVRDVAAERPQAQEDGCVVNLFRLGEFKLHSGGVSRFKIDCDALSDDDLRALAEIAAKALPLFSAVEGVPTGGLRFAAFMQRHAVGATAGLLIVDDVCTTGRSLEAQRNGRDAIGVVIFARGPVPSWVTPLFNMEVDP